VEVAGREVGSIRLDMAGTITQTGHGSLSEQGGGLRAGPLPGASPDRFMVKARPVFLCHVTKRQVGVRKGPKAVTRGVF